MSVLSGEIQDIDPSIQLCSLQKLCSWSSFLDATRAMSLASPVFAICKSKLSFAQDLAEKSQTGLVLLIVGVASTT